MTNQRFNSLAILNTYKTFTDKLNLCIIGNDFKSKNGQFTEADLLGLCIKEKGKITL